MKVTLRKAAQIQSLIQTALTEKTPKIDVKISIFDTPASIIDDAAIESRKNLQIVEDLLRILYNIRRSVSKINMTSGISDLMTDEAEVNHRIRLYEALSLMSNERPKDAVVNATLSSAKVKFEDPESYSSDTKISFPIFNFEDVTSFQETLYALKVLKSEISDKLLNLNTQTQVEISDVDYEFLKSNKVL